MVEAELQPMPDDPLSWQPEHMWGWVNQAAPHVKAQSAVSANGIEIMQGLGRLRPIIVNFDQLGRIVAHGYSWENHVEDEMLQIRFLTDRIMLSTIQALPEVLLARLITVAGMVRMADAQSSRRLVGHATLSMGDGDWGRDCLAFASQTAGGWLVPDPYFILTRAYADEKQAIAGAARPWLERKPQLYWRGAPSGLQKYADHANSQRVRLVMRGVTSAFPERFDVRFAGLDGMDAQVAQAVRDVGGDGPRDPQLNILNYRYNVDVDGWSCAWTGFFTKLLAGAPVLKITSDRGFRQWYYDQLQPWRHMVPVAEDLVDLEMAVGVLDARPDWAQEIGAKGKILAERLSFESQFEVAGQQINRFVEAHA